MSQVQFAQNPAGDPTAPVSSTAAIEPAAIAAQSTAAVPAPVETAAAPDTQKQAALEAIIAGHTMGQAAQIADVSRSTLYNWIKQDPCFLAALNQWRDEIHEMCHDRLMGLAERATQALERSLETADAKVALQLLKGLGLLEKRKIGCADPGELRVHLNQQDRERTLARARRNVELDAMTKEVQMLQFYAHPPDPKEVLEEYQKEFQNEWENEEQEEEEDQEDCEERDREE